MKKRGKFLGTWIWSSTNKCAGLFFLLMYTEAGIISYVHGNRNRLMKLADYRNIKNCSTVEEMKTKLQNTVYGKALLEEPVVTSKTLRRVLYKCMKEEIQRTLSFATPLARDIVNYYREYHQLNNFIYLWACKQDDPRNLEGPLDTHELGEYDGLNFIKVTQGPEDTWKFCLENTPLQKYIRGLRSSILKDDIQYVTNILQKNYIEMLYAFSLQHKLYLTEYVQFEADKRVIEILHSTLYSPMPPRDKASLFPACSTFSVQTKKQLLQCSSFDELKGALSTHRKYRDIVGNEMGLENALRREEIRICKRAFVLYDDPSVVFMQFKLQELEISNLIFISDCITHRHPENIEEVLDSE